MDVVFETPEDYGVRVDLSSLDFEKIEKEFSKPERRNTTVQSLKSIVEHTLNQMVDQNPTRIDYYERYQEIIDAYNRGKDEVSIRETFDQLGKLIDDLSDEEARASREELTEEQLAVFDLLRSDKKLKDKKRHAVKEIARELLERLQENELQVEHWAEKIQTAAAVRKAINDYLFEKLPYPEYDEEDIVVQAERVYGYVVGRYAA